MRRSRNIARRVDVGWHVWIYGRLRRRTYFFGRIVYPHGSKVQGGESFRNRVPVNIARRVDVGSACVDIRPSAEDGRSCLLLTCIFLVSIIRICSTSDVQMQ